MADPEGGGLPGSLNFQKRTVTSMGVVMDLVVTSYSPDFLSEGPFQLARLNTNTLFALGEQELFGDIEVRLATSVRSCS